MAVFGGKLRIATRIRRFASTHCPLKPDFSPIARIERGGDEKTRLMNDDRAYRPLRCSVLLRCGEMTGGTHFDQIIFFDFFHN